jgi:hypothetical protein
VYFSDIKGISAVVERFLRSQRKRVRNVSERMSVLGQDDFTALGFGAGQDDDLRHLDNIQGLPIAAERAGSPSAFKSGIACRVDESYRPINFISDEVCEMIRNWELSYLKKQEAALVIDAMEMESSTFVQSETISCVSEPPPKRFYRTFWTSLMRKVLQRQEDI